MTGRPLTVQEVANVLPAFGRCPHHPQYVILPWYSFRACCLYEALQRIRDGEEDPRAIAEAAMQPPDERIKVRPDLRRR